jgi:hypothetical protein
MGNQMPFSTMFDGSLSATLLTYNLPLSTSTFHQDVIVIGSCSDTPVKYSVQIVPPTIETTYSPYPGVLIGSGDTFSSKYIRLVSFNPMFIYLKKVDNPDLQFGPIDFESSTISAYPNRDRSRPLPDFGCCEDDGSLALTLNFRQPNVQPTGDFIVDIIYRQYFKIDSLVLQVLPPPYVVEFSSPLTSDANGISYYIVPSDQSLSVTLRPENSLHPLFPSDFSCSTFLNQPLAFDSDQTDGSVSITLPANLPQGLYYERLVISSCNFNNINVYSVRVIPPNPQPPPPANPPPPPPPANPPPPPPPTVDNVDPTQSQVLGTEFPDGVTNTAVSFNVELKDLTGQLITDVDPNSLLVRVFKGKNRDIDVSKIRNSDGTFTCSYIPTKPGRWRIQVKINGQHVLGSPASTIIRPNHGHQ